MKSKYTKKQIQETITHWTAVLESMDSASGLWDEHGDGGAQDAESFKKVVCSLLKTDEVSFYEQFVPEKYDSFEGDWTAVDDRDLWKVNHQDTLPRKQFWDLLYDECADDSRILDGIPLAEFKEAVEENAQKIADEAWENYEPDEGVDILVRRGCRD